MLQLIDVAHPNLPTKISGVDRIFLAPEVLGSKQNGSKGSADMWSLGVMLYFLVTGGITTENDSDEVEMFFNEPQWDYYSLEMRLFIERLLEVDCTVRPSVSQMLDDPFMQMHRGKILETEKGLYEEVDNDAQINCYKL